MTIVLKVLKDYHHNDSLPSFHYNNMLEELQIVAPDITEETLLQHGELIVQQIHSYDTSADNDEQNLLSAPFIKELCKFIVDKAEDKNPANVNGSTPLHVAAAEGELEIFEMIANKVTNINPRDNVGWTPLHGAAQYGHREMCEFIADKVEDKNPECDNGWTPQELMWNKICGIDV